MTGPVLPPAGSLGPVDLRRHQTSVSFLDGKRRDAGSAQLKHEFKKKKKKGTSVKALPLTWVGQDLFSRGNVDKPLLRLLLLRLRLEVVGVPLLRQLPVSLDDLLLVGAPK